MLIMGKKFEIYPEYEVHRYYRGKTGYRLGMLHLSKH
jgi:hypothetical protein